MRTTEVFGVSNEEIASYIVRNQVDERFIEGLQRNKHIIVFGASKQGKTSLTNKYLKESEFIRINCSPQTKVIDIYKSILRQLKVEFIETFIEQKAKTSDEIPLYLGYYFIRVLFDLSFQDIEAGLKRKFIHGKIKEIHHRPDDVRSSDMGYFLSNIIQNQINKNIIPPLFDYDRSTSTIKIIDSTLYFFLKTADKEEILSEFETPAHI